MVDETRSSIAEKKYTPPSDDITLIEE